MEMRSHKAHATISEIYSDSDPEAGPYWMDGTHVHYHSFYIDFCTDLPTYYSSNGLGGVTLTASLNDSRRSRE